MQNAEPVLDVIRARHRARADVITGEQGAGKLACPVREGADGKGSGDRDLAGGLLHFGAERSGRLLRLGQLKGALAWSGS